MLQAVPRALSSSLVVVAALSAGAGASRAAPIRVMRAVEPRGPNAAIALTTCPPLMIPDGDVCVHLPGDDDAPELDSALNAHREVDGRWASYDEIPRRPDRPADYYAYRYPVPCERHCVASGFDLDRPDTQQRRRPGLKYVGHGAVDLPEPKGTPIVEVPLEHQLGDADVVYVGALFGTTVITRRTLQEGKRTREYLVLFGHLAAAAPGVRAGTSLKEGEAVGLVGDTDSPGWAHLHLEVRRVRDGVLVPKLGPEAMIANENSVVCDPRNVLRQRSLP